MTAEMKIANLREELDSSNRVMEGLFNENAELRTEVKELKDTQDMLSTCDYLDWKQFQRRNGE